MSHRQKTTPDIIGLTIFLVAMNAWKDSCWPGKG